MPREHEMARMELAEVIAVRERARRNRSLEGRPLLQEPFLLGGLLQVHGASSSAESKCTCKGERCFQLYFVNVNVEFKWKWCF